MGHPVQKYLIKMYLGQDILVLLLCAMLHILCIQKWKNEQISVLISIFCVFHFNVIFYTELRMFTF